MGRKLHYRVGGNGSVGVGPTFFLGWGHFLSPYHHFLFSHHSTQAGHIHLRCLD